MHTAMALPFAVLITSGIFSGVPKELEEAAMFTLVISWNEVFAAAILTVHNRTLPAQVLTSLEDGEFLGPSGCGKTTTLRCIAGLERVDTGRIFIGGRDVTKLPPARRDIAMVFQSYAVFPHMTVAQNIGFWLRMRHVPKREIRATVQEAAKLLQIEELLDRYPAQLSGGQR